MKEGAIFNVSAKKEEVAPSRLSARIRSVSANGKVEITFNMRMAVLEGLGQEDIEVRVKVEGENQSTSQKINWKLACNNDLHLLTL